MMSSINSTISKKSAVQASPANQPLTTLALVPKITQARVPSPRIDDRLGLSNITKLAVDLRQITFFEPGKPISRVLQQQHTDAVVLHLQHLFAQSPSPTIVLGASYMNVRGAQLAHYLKQQGLVVYIDGFAKLTQFYQLNHANIQKLASAATQVITDERPLIYFGETHMMHKMVASPHHFIQRIEQAWQQGSLNLVAEQHAVFSGKQQTFCSSAQQVVNQLLKGYQPVPVVNVEGLTTQQTNQLFDNVSVCIDQARDWPEAMATIFVLLNHLPTAEGSAVFDVGSESLSLLNKLCELNSAPHFSASALRSMLQGAIGDALSNLKELVNYAGEREALPRILPIAVLGDTAFVNGGGQHIMLKFAEHMQKAFLAVIVLNNHQQKIENSIAAAPVKGHHNGQHITQGSCVYRVSNLKALKQVLLEYVTKLNLVTKGYSVRNMLIDLDLTPDSELISLAKPINLLNPNSARVDNLTRLIDGVFTSFKQPELHGYACSFFELVHEITKVESSLPRFHYHATITDQGVFAGLAFHMATALEQAQSSSAASKRYARLIFMNSCFPVRLPDQIPQILSSPVSPLLPIFVVADTPNQATSPYAMGLPHREFLTATVPAENMFQAASKVEGDIQFLNTANADWLTAFAKALNDTQLKILVVRM